MTNSTKRNRRLLCRALLLALTAATVLLKPGIVLAAFGCGSDKIMATGLAGCIQMLLGGTD